jgi:hypothetical protein
MEGNYLGLILMYYSNIGKQGDLGKAPDMIVDIWIGIGIRKSVNH